MERTLGKLFNLDSFRVSDEKMFEYKEKFGDALPGIIAAQHLRVFDPRIFERKYPNQAFFNTGINVDNSGGYAQEIISQAIIENGAYRIADDNADDKGKISLSGAISTIGVAEVIAGSDWTDTHAKQAELGNYNLIERLTAAHLKAYRELIDDVYIRGIGRSNTGIINTPLFNVVPAGTPASALSNEALLTYLITQINAQFAATNFTGGYTPNEMLMPSSLMQRLATSFINTANGSNITILQALKNMYSVESGMFINFISSTKVEAANNGGVSYVSIYSNNWDAMNMRIPLPFTMGEIYKKQSFYFGFDSKARIAGLDILLEGIGVNITGL